MPLSFLLEVVEGIPDRPLKIHSVQLKHRSVVNSLEWNVFINIIGNICSNFVFPIKMFHPYLPHCEIFVYLPQNTYTIDMLYYCIWCLVFTLVYIYSPKKRRNSYTITLYHTIWMAWHLKYYRSLISFITQLVQIVLVAAIKNFVKPIYYKCNCTTYPCFQPELHYYCVSSSW